MPVFDFDTPVDRRHTASAKWDRYRGTDILPMWVADMDFRSPPAVIEAIRQQAEHGVFGYPNVPDGLPEATIEWLDGRYAWAVDPSWLVWIPGIVVGLNVSCRAVGDDGDAVITTTPIYPPFLSAPRYSRRTLVPVPLRSDATGWQIDWRELQRRMTADARLFLLCNPHNPVGKAYRQADLQKLADICLRRDIRICSDEIHCDLTLEPDRRHIPIATLDPEIASRTITLMAPSKTFNIPGLGCGFAVISDDRLRSRFKRAMQGIVPHVNGIGFAAALAAYRSGGDWLARLIAYLRANRDEVERVVGRIPGLSTWPVEATYLSWIDCRSSGIDHPVAFFEKAGVGLSDGREFGAPGFLRLNFGCPRSALRQGLNRIERAMAAV